MGGFKFICCTAPKVDEGRGHGQATYPVEAFRSPTTQHSEAGAFRSSFVPSPTSDFHKPEPLPGKVEEVTDIIPVAVKGKPRPMVEWVVGLDFGTTFSGFAYAKATGPEKINTYYDWPNRSSEKPYCKTLTGIYYTQAGPGGKLQCVSWGNLARSDFMASKSRGGAPAGFYLSKFKLLLKKDLDDPILASSIPPPLTVNTVITDYLRNIGELALTVIKNHEGEARFRRDSVQWCVTVPSIWDESSKQQMKACMVNAGLVSGETGGIESVKVVLEPEAASFHCHQILQQDMKDQRDVKLHAKDKILVADVGGGTVDIVVQEMIGNGDNYRVRELTESSGGLCGGTFVDDSFLRFLSRKIGCLDEFLRSGVPSYRARLLKDWEEIKCGFGHEMRSNATTEITLHNRLAVKWEAFDKERGLPPRDSYTEIELTQQDLKLIFDPVVDEILELIAAQLMHVEDIKVMFVVGGFAGSPYLLQRIRARFSGDVKHIVSPPNPGSAIIQGAVSLARNPKAYDVDRILKKTYGTSVTLLDYNPGVDPSHLLKIDKAGGRWCRNRFDIFVRRGSRIAVNEVVTKEYVPHSDGQTQMLFDLYSSVDQEPKYTEGPNVTNEGGFSVSLPKNYNRENLPLFKFSMYFGRSSIELKVEAQFKQAHGNRMRTMELPVAYYS